MEVTFLGCGSSLGLPIVGCDCTLCKSNDPKNSRLRSSIVVTEGDNHILIDTSPDLRQQMLRTGLNQFLNVFYTHGHADHCHGIDDLRAMWIKHHTVNVFSTEEVLTELSNKFHHLFVDVCGSKNGFLIKKPIKLYEEIKVAGMNIIPYLQQHGSKHSIGYKIGNLAYSTDVNHLPERSIEILKKNVDILILGCIGYKEHLAHANVEQCLRWHQEIQPRTTILTHLGHDIEYHSLISQLPKGVIPAFDGMTLDVSRR